VLERTSYYDDDYGYDVDHYRLGLMARILSSLSRHPWRTALTVVLAAAVTAIVANAVFLQSSDHPSPFFVTRDDGAAAGVVNQEGIVNPIAAREAVPVDAIGRLVEVTVAGTPQLQTNPASATVVEVQQLLAAQGYDPGIIDGLFGTRTQSAVELFQAQNGLVVTGVVSDALVDSLRATTPDPASEVLILPTAETRILAVQTALNQIGYGPVLANGQLSGETAEAVRAFQLEYGLTITGEIDQALVGRMVDIGALEPF
jgi:peptidoglycan hydrolase-like protein with peptidoglycan-binding domain